MSRIFHASLIGLLLALLPASLAQAQVCEREQIKFMIGSKDKDKLSFGEFDDGTPPSDPPKYYRKHTVRFNETVSIVFPGAYGSDDVWSLSQGTTNVTVTTNATTVSGVLSYYYKDTNSPPNITDCSTALDANGSWESGTCSGYYATATYIYGTWWQSGMVTTTKTTHTVPASIGVYGVVAAQSTVTELTDEYTDAEIKTELATEVGSADFSGTWSETQEPAKVFHVGGSTWRAQKVKFRVPIEDSIEGEVYTVTWEELSADGTTKPRSGSVTGDGGTVYFESPEILPGPHGEDVTISNIEAKDGEGNCLTCPDATAGASEPGAEDADVGSVRFTLSLGMRARGKSAGTLKLYALTPGTNLYQPAGLIYHGGTYPDVQVITNGGALRQVRTPHILADIVAQNASQYQIRLFSTNAIGTNSGGLYLTNSSAYVTWTVSNPDAGSATNRLQLVHQRGAQFRTNLYTFNATNSSWTLSAANGLRQVEVLPTYNSTNGTRTETRTVRGDSSQTVSKEFRVWAKFPFGTALVTNIVDPDGAALTTTYEYYTNGPLKRIIRPTGDWEYHEYDESQRRTLTLRSFGNQTLTTDASLGRATYYSYAPLEGSDDDGTRHAGTPRQEIEKLLGVEVGRRYRIFSAGERRDIVCQTAEAAWSATDNLVTTTKLYTEGVNKNRTLSIQRPDGTMSLYDYEVDGATNLTTVVWSGQPNGAGTAVTNGTKLVTLQGPLGNVIARTTVDIATEITTGSETFSDFDEFGRPGRVTYLDSTFKLFTYICCGVESETDRDGVTTTYAYDNLKRRIGSYRNGIWHLNTLDAAGRTLFTQRQGTNASTITLASMVYDIAGRLLYQTNAVGNVTSFGEAIDGSGQTVKSTTNALGATRIETHFKDGSLQSVTGTAVHGVRYEYGIESSLPYTKEIKLLTDGTDSSEWTKTFTDMAGRLFKTVYADDAYTQSYFNNAGQLWKQHDADGVVTLHQYNALGEAEYTVLDMDRNDTIDFDGTDRITRTVRDVVAAHSTNVRRTRSYVWTDNSSTNSLLTSTVEAAVDGTRTWQTAFGLTSENVSLCGGACVATNIAPDGSYTTTLKTNGYVMVVTRYDSQGSQLGATTYTYDEHGRQKTITDARNGTTTLIYDDADRVNSVTTPVPASGQSSQTTTSYYDELGRVWRTVQPDSTSVTNEFHLTGELKKTYGSRTYPVEYTYDYAGRMKTLKTWQDFVGNTGTATTTWNYSSTRGWLTGKLYADDQGPTYTHTAGGRLATRVWARGITTTYTYDYAGQLTQTSYDDSVTPTAYTTYDRQGRQITSAAGDLTTTRTYNDAGQLLGESHSGGVLDGLAITNSYDAFLRRTNLSAFNVSTQLSASIYGYDHASRLSTVSDGTNNATYGYLANSALVDSIVFKQNSTTRMTRTNRYDFLNRLTSITQSAGGSNVSAFNYAYNDANQRVAVTNVDNSRWSWGYDSLGQVTSGKKYWIDNSIAAGQQFEYAFDDIGNRKQAAAGGNQFGTNLRTNTYGPNVLNQYTNRTVAGYVEVLGSANSNATVTVNNESTYRKGEYFRKELPVSNSSAAVWQGITNVAVLAGAGTNDTDIVTTKTGSVLVPQTPEAFTYDADGNMTSDGRFTYTWDAENRLLAAESLTAAPAASRVRTEWAYQPDGRWSQRVALNWDGSAYVANATNRFVWDDKVLLAVLDGDGQTTQAYLRGSDLSWSMGGAGGVGGLLAVSAAANGVHFAAFDGNGNVSGLLSASNSTLTASYEYGPFGETLRATGPMALVNSLRFSTQFADDVTGHLKYLYREYLPGLGRWLNRDPIRERGGINLFAFVHNSPLTHFDVLGETIYTVVSITTTVVLCGVLVVVVYNYVFAPGSPVGGMTTTCAGTSTQLKCDKCCDIAFGPSGIHPTASALVSCKSICTTKP